MKCSEVIPLLDLLGGEDLSLEEERAVQAHLQQCQSCKSKLDGVTDMKRHLSTISFEGMEEEIPETTQPGFWADMTDSVMDSLEEPAQVRRAAGGLVWFMSGFGAAASLFILAWLVLGGPKTFTNEDGLPGNPGGVGSLASKPVLTPVNGPINGRNPLEVLDPKTGLPVNLDKRGWPQVPVRYTAPRYGRGGNNVLVGDRKTDF